MDRFHMAALCAAAGLFCAVELRAELETPIALRNARITVSIGRELENANILIDGGRIVAVGEVIEIPDNARVIDATGLFVYPGFIDSNTHLGISREEPSDEQRARLEDENPDVRQGPQSATVQAYRRLMHPSWRADELFEPAAATARPGQSAARSAGRVGEAPASSPPTADVREEHRQAGFTAALVSPKPAIFSGSSMVLQLGDAPLRRSILRAGFAQHCAFTTGVDPDAFMDRRMMFERPRYPATTMGAIAAFRQIILDADWHRRLVAWSENHPREEQPPLDRDLEALREIADASMPVVFIANTENEIHRALDVAAEFKLRPIIAGAREGWKAVERLKREGVPVLLSLKWSEEPRLKERPRRDEAANPAVGTTSGPSRGPATRGAPAASHPRRTAEDKPVFDAEWESQPFEPQRRFEERKRLWGEEVDNAWRLAEAGVRFAVTSFEMKSPADLLKNLRQAMKRGLPNDVALAALTANAADLLGQTGLLGRIAPGHLANLTILTKPLADDEAKVHWVFVGGRRFDVSAGAGGEDNGERRKSGRRKDGGAAAGQDASAAGPSSGASAATTSQEAADFPDFACEIEADRKPVIRTGGNVLLRGVNILTLTGQDLPGADLLVQDGRIAATGKNLPAPAGVLVLDLPGYFVTPGLIDPHSHICTSGGLNEGSLSVTCEVRVSDVIDHTSVAAYRALAGGVTAIHTMHGSSNTIGGQNAVLRLKYGRPAAEWLFREAPRTVKFALGENVKQSNTDRQSRGTRFPNSRAGVEAVIRRSLDAALDYKADRNTFESGKAAGRDPRPIRRDLRLEALAAIHDGEIWVHCHCYRADEILRLLTTAEEYGFRVGVLQHVLEGYRLIPEMHRHGCGASTFSDWWAYKIEAYDAIPHNAARMLQAGVVTTINSDSAEVMRHLNLEAAKSLRYGGLTPSDALGLCTLNAAIQLGIDQHVGTIEPGKLADLAVFDAHPLDTFSKCVLTFIDGEVFFQHPALQVRNPAPPRPRRPFGRQGPSAAHAGRSFRRPLPAATIDSRAARFTP